MLKIYFVRNGNGHWLSAEPVSVSWSYADCARLFIDRQQAEREAKRMSGRVVEFVEVVP